MMQCPIDGERLVMADRNGVEIDYCPKCRGVWLDRGELDKIVERAAAADGSSGRDDRRADHRQDSRDEERRHSSDERRGHSDDYRGDQRGDYRGDQRGKRRESFLSDLFDF